MSATSTTTTPTIASTLLAEVATGSGSNSQATQISTSSITLFIDVTAISGSFDVTVKTYDDDSSNARVVWQVHDIDAVTPAPIVATINHLATNLLVEVSYDAAVTYNIKYRTPISSDLAEYWDGDRYVQAVHIENPTTAYGEMAVANLTPVAQLDPNYGVRSKTDTEVFVGNSGTTGTELVSGYGFEYKCTTGTNVGGYGIIRARRAIRYRSGQGVIYRAAARFSTSVADNIQRVGAVNIGTELSFGYNTDQNFTILHRTGGKQEIVRLTLSAAASGAETATVTLPGTSPVNVAITAGTIAHNAYELAAASYTGWDVYQNGSTVTFFANAVGDRTGTLSYSSTGTSAGTFATTQEGAAVTDTHINQEDWNVDPMDGTGPSGVNLAPTKGNIYQIQQQYMGYGNIDFSIEDSETGHMQLVHRIKYTNRNVGPSLIAPYLKIGGYTANIGNSSDVSFYMGALAGFVEGQAVSLRNPDSIANTKTGVTTTLTNVLAVRVRPEFNNRENLTDIVPKSLIVSVDGTKPAAVKLVINPTLGGEPNWTYKNQTDSIVEYDTAATTVTVAASSQTVFTANVAKAGSISIDLKDLDINLVRGDVISVAVQATSGTTDATASITWSEE